MSASAGSAEAQVAGEVQRHAAVHRALDQPFGSRSRFFVNHLLTGICYVVTVVAMVPLLSIVFLVFQKGLPHLSWRIFTQLPPPPGITEGGFGNAIVGTAIMVGMAMAMASPVGILAAVYICEYRPNAPLSKAVRFSARLLTGIPSIICGVFAFAAVVLTLGHFSALAGSVALAVLALPTIILTTEQALLGVPDAYREGSYGLGASRFQTIRRMVLPQAAPGILTGLMLALARAAGETAPVLFTALFNVYWSGSPLQPAASLSVLIYNYSALPYDYQIGLAWTASLVLVSLVTLTNVAAQLIFTRRHP
jgi:phosphate transport system permease protein